ncbi:hypothetical protein [Streptomyces sp. WZ.A104]|uniref:hypothetical protein n=1 Tax=Streptomyces sp. WZ.A104 TaxID=2023771 RepID=UPI0015C6A393|nr:hypothetical protein [Streptomyces sp. WZ.A104]
MIYASHRVKGAPVLGALPGQEGPFGRRPAPGEDEDSLRDLEERAADVPAPRARSER